MKKLQTIAFAAALVAPLFAYGYGSAKAKQPTIAEIAASNENFSTLVTALKAADLVDPLASKGSFTVFAPTNDAFAKLPEGTVEALLADKEALKAVLLYHVAGEQLDASQVTQRATIATLQGSPVAVKANYGVKVNGSKVTTANIKASNGIVHVIDTVLLPDQAPKASASIVDLAVKTDSLSTLVSLLKSADLVDALAGSGEFTVLAPTNDAFAKLPKEALTFLQNNPQALKQVLLYHVVSGSVRSEQVASVSSVRTLSGKSISLAEGSALLKPENHVMLNVKATNGIVHVIDTVLLPPDLKIGQTSAPRKPRGFSRASY
ncbi:MAG: fasciclin domain-containing protein [Opitutales bacterium]